ncbi:putative hydroxyacylglutathione hydrolase [Buchnera aphidicola str. Bp (Baizongia pistaciae)]|uniref:Hydroxyacylglutathione hydrolase n=1 Tax=Buchnera aphidicola subsp. Baizongia pistaciae (strain Bp) TaxID=224915 RepID=GLO2_BUCBP|nr:hydroxyacylglutathione hydrolase [Buchnera aphidicola]Q89AN4.1 RecName: Full=Hydroxyacylglutathione hydrolase; AltName: Full=Glyoxalase II; Short=Glx II [Buchnera aphidicola str. Bp (Baizongia pistaciae)]AAO26956.1 putative hydroxyacylglutathione hydrolase [Buchnera aphidicola str. Bp (Baizongia pistaciae)]
MKIIFTKVLFDNYVWIMFNSSKDCIIIDPGESNSVIKKIKKLNLNPKIILLTHNHLDHIQGVKNLLYKYPEISIYGPLETQFCGTKNLIDNRNTIEILNTKFYIIPTPGHTNGHTAYYCPPFLFCGDSIFSGGCGRVKNGMMIKMYNSLRTISKLPNDTLIYCSHEYTRSNLEFFKKIFPKNLNILNYYNNIKKSKTQCTLPSTLKIEKKINPFLQLNNTNLRHQVKIHNDLSFSLNFFIYLRKIKDKS